VVLEYGDVAALAGRNWNCLEFSSERAVEQVLRRVASKIPTLFGKDPVEMFVPVLKRDLDLFDLASANMIFVRSKNQAALGRFRSVTGCLGLVMSNENAYRYKNAISVEDTYIQEIILEDQRRHENLSANVKIGSFVRIIDGEVRGYCGLVQSMTDSRATVAITTSRTIYLDTPIRNLLLLDHVQQDKRAYYFSSLIEELEDTSLLPVFVEDVQPEDFPAPRVRTPRDASTTQSITRMIKAGEHNPLQIATATLAGYQSGDILPPVRNLVILSTMIKNSLLDWEKSHSHPKWRTWREMACALGEPYKSFSPMQVAAACPNCGIGILTRDKRARRKCHKRTRTQFPRIRRKSKS